MLSPTKPGWRFCPQSFPWPVSEPGAIWPPYCFPGARCLMWPGNSSSPWARSPPLCLKFMFIGVRCKSRGDFLESNSASSHVLRTLCLHTQWNWRGVRLLLSTRFNNVLWEAVFKMPRPCLQSDPTSHISLVFCKRRESKRLITGKGARNLLIQEKQFLKRKTKVIVILIFLKWPSWDLWLSSFFFFF